MQNSIEAIRKMLIHSSCTVFFGGAGVSTDSGIPDFRGTRGLYTAPDDAFDDPPEYLLSHWCLTREPQKFYSYYRNHMLYPDAKPNAAHIALAQMEEQGLLQAVITQNIDGLHQLAGSRNVLELHGTTRRHFCMRCGKPFGALPDIDEADEDGIPRCSCGGMIRPDVVLYGEGLNENVFDAAEEAVSEAEVLLVGGTSLTVNPAASLVGRFRGKHLVIINLSETPYDEYAEIILRSPLSEVLPKLF